MRLTKKDAGGIIITLDQSIGSVDDAIRKLARYEDGRPDLAAKLSWLAGSEKSPYKCQILHEAADALKGEEA